MALPKRIQEAVCFANFCRNYHLDPAPVGTLANAVNAAYRAGTREGNGLPNTADKARRRVERIASELGLTTDWSGLYPSFTRTTESGTTYAVHFPTF